MEFTTDTIITIVLVGLIMGGLGFWLGIEFSHWVGKRILERATGKQFDDLMSEVERDVDDQLKNRIRDREPNKPRAVELRQEGDRWYAWTLDGEFVTWRETLDELKAVIRDQHQLYYVERVVS